MLEVRNLVQHPASREGGTREWEGQEGGGKDKRKRKNDTFYIVTVTLKVKEG